MHSMPSSSSRDYGALKHRGDVEDFDADDTYYLKDSNRKFTYKKLLLIVVPILAASLIIGGAAFLLYRNFNHLYPGPNGSGQSTKYSSKTHVVSSNTKDSSSSNSNRNNNNGPISTTSKESDDYSSTTSKNRDEDSASCENNSNCAEKGLLGFCCPTVIGEMLNCCD